MGWRQRNKDGRLEKHVVTFHNIFQFLIPCSIE